MLGANGSGKTTLLKVLMQLVKPQRGQVLLNQDDVRELRPADVYRRVGMVFQNPTDQLFAATVEQDVAFGPANLDLPPTEIAARTDEALAAVDGLEFRDRPIHDLSFGQQKRVCLAGVLAMRPPILLLDEPTAGLDPAGESQMAELLLRLHRRQATTIIVCTHAVDLLPVLADRVTCSATAASGGKVRPRTCSAIRRRWPRPACDCRLWPSCSTTWPAGTASRCRGFP